MNRKRQEIRAKHLYNLKIICGKMFCFFSFLHRGSCVCKCFGDVCCLKLETNSQNPKKKEVTRRLRETVTAARKRCSVAEGGVGWAGRREGWMDGSQVGVRKEARREDGGSAGGMIEGWWEYREKEEGGGEQQWEGWRRRRNMSCVVLFSSRGQ